MLPLGFSQSRLVISENFDKNSHTFMVSPASHWRQDTLLSVSGRKSVWGMVPNAEGDSVELISPIYDLTQYEFAYLRFSHICKVSDSDIVTVECREDYVGSKWKPLPRQDYKGTASSYRRAARFHHASYSQWKSGDLLVEPDNSWWKTEAFDVSAVVAYARVQFKFKIKKGRTIGTNFAWGWFIDNFELTCANAPINPPTVEFLPPFTEGTVYSTGPFTVYAKAVKRTVFPIYPPKLYLSYTPLNGVQRRDSIQMTSYEGDSLWMAVIPQQNIGTQVAYTVTAKDSAGNMASASSGYVIGREWGYDSNSVAILSIDTPQRGALADKSNPVFVTIQNRGLKVLQSAMIYWSVNGVLQQPYAWTGNMPEGYTQSVQVGSYVARNAYDTLVVWVSQPNGVPNTTSDTMVTSRPYGCQQIFAGTYTVGANGTFKTIGEALFALNLCGMSGNVVLSVEKGEYYETLDFTDYMDLIGPKDTLTLVSASGNAEDVVIYPDPKEAGHIMTFQRARNIVISHLMLNGLTSPRYVVNLTDTNANIEFNHCIVMADTSMSSGRGPTAIRIENLNRTTSFRTRLLYNKIMGGDYGVGMYGASDLRVDQVTIIGNEITRFNMSALQGKGIRFDYVNNNVFVPRNSAELTPTFVELGDLTAEEICGNRFRNLEAQRSAYGMNLSGFNRDSSAKGLIANNEFVINLVSDGFAVNLNESCFDFVNNSAVVNGGDSKIFSFYCANRNKNLSMNIHNNIFVCYNNGWPMYFDDPTTLGANVLLDYNNCYGRTYIGYCKSEVTDLATWISLTGDQHATNVNPAFIDPTTSAKCVFYSGLVCPKHVGVDEDIDGMQRLASTTMGCYSELPYPFNAALTAFVDWQSSYATTGSYPVKVILMNAGSTDTLRSCTLQWMLNGTRQKDQTWKGELIPFTSDTVTVGMFTPEAGKNTLTVWVTMQNGMRSDNKPSDDSVSTTTYGCKAPLSGELTIGNDPAADFQTLEDALSLLANCGMSASVTFKLLPGTYPAISLIGPINGLGGKRFLTITSSTGKASDVVILASNTGVKLSGISNFQLSNVTIDAKKGGDGIVLSGAMSDVEISHCRILLDPSTSATQRGICAESDGNLRNNVRIIGNLIDGGYYGIYMYNGSGNAAAQHGRYNVIDSNEIINMYYYGVYVCNTDFQSISHNRVIARQRGGYNYFYGIYAYYCNTKNIIGNFIDANREFITNTNGPLRSYCSNYSTYAQSTSDVTLIANNEIRASSVSGYVYGIYDYYGNSKVINNSVYVNNPYNYGYGMYIYTASGYMKELRNNNLIYINGGANSYPMYVNSKATAQVTVADNNYYHQGHANLAYFAAACTSLSAVQAVDATATNVYPDFIDLTKDMRIRKNSNVSALSCQTSGDVMVDFDENPRDRSTIRGAYNATELKYNAALKGFTSPKSTVKPGESVTVTVTLENAGDSVLTSATIYWSVNGKNFTPYQWKGSLASEKQESVTLGTFTGDVNSNLIVAYVHLNDHVDALGVDDTISLNAFGCATPMKGSYLVGKGGDFASLDEAVAALQLCGVDAPVEMKLAKGVYQDVSFSGIYPGSSAVNTVTFLPASGVKGDVVFTGNVITTALNLNAVGYLRFQQIVIGDTNSDVMALELVSTLTDVTFRDCDFYAMRGDVNSQAYCVYHNATTYAMIKDLRFTHCLFYGGYNNLLLSYGGASNSNFGNITLDSCRMLNAYYYGFQCATAYYKLTARDNYFHNAPNSSSYRAFSFGNSAAYINIDSMVRNRIWITSSSQGYGIYIGQNINYSGPLAKVPACVYNNEIIIEGKTSTAYGFDFSSSSANTFMDMRHNTIYINTNGTTRYGIYNYNTSTASHFGFFNNLVYIGGTSGTGECLHHSQNATYFTNTYIDMNYNVYYNDQKMIGHGASSMQAWIQLVNNDINSKYERVVFTDPASYNFHNAGTYALVPADPYVPYDKNGIFRTSLTNAGCYHDFVPAAYDVQVAAITNPENGAVTGDKDSVMVSIRNLGKSSVSSVTVQWTLNGVRQPDYIWKSATALDYGSVVSNVNIGGFTVPSGKYRVVAWTVNPDGNTDADPSNDTAAVNVIACDSTLKGTYTVGGAGANFATLEDALTALKSCGVAGPVVMRVNSGIYDELEIVGSIRGASATNTVTFTSVANDANAVVIGDLAKVSLKLRNTSHLIFDKLTFGSMAASSPENAVQFEGDAEDIHFRHCNLYVCTSNTNSNYRVVMYNNAQNADNYMHNVSFIGNQVRGGYYGFYVAYGGGNAANCKTSAARRASLVIDSNYIADQYYYGIYAQYYTRIPSLSYNTIVSRNGVSSHYGMYLAQYCVVDSIIGNRIRSIATNYAYGGIYLTMYNNYTSTFGSDILPTLVANNEIVSMAASTAYGIRTQYASANILHNSVYCEAATNYGMQINTSAAACPLNVKNNIFVNGNGSSTDYLMYVSAAATLTTYPTTIDSNNYYTFSTKTTNFYCGGAKNLATWRSSYSKDVNSVTVKPDFQNLPNDLSITQFSDLFKVTRHALVPRDINGGARTSLSVMGAYSTPLFEGHDLMVKAYVDPQTGGIQCVPNSTPVSLRLYNQGTYVADFAKTPLKLYLKCESDSVNLQTSVTVNTGSINVMAYDTFEIMSNLDITYPGMYKLTAWIEWSGDEQLFNDTLKLDYYVDKTILPYENNFTGPEVTLSTDQAYGTISWELTDNNPVLNPVFGTGSLLFRSSESRGSISQALFTSMTLQGTYRPQLYFWYAHDNANPNLRDQMEVRISLDGGATFETLKTLYRYDAQCKTPTWKKYQIDLSKYTTGRCIVVAFTAYSYGGGDQTVDQVRIVAMQDMQVTVDAPKEADFAACNMTGRNLTVYLENLTSQEVPFKAGDSLTVEMSGASNFVYRKALNGRLENREIDTLTLGPIDYVGGGQFDVKVYVNSIDSNVANDTARYSLYLNPDLAVASVDTIGVKRTGDTVYAGMTIVNNGNLDVVSPFEVRLLINREDTITERISQGLQAGASMHYTFQKSFVVPAATADQPFFLLDAIVLLPCDAYADNDSVRVYGNVHSVDMGILSITTPTETSCTLGGSMATIEVRLFNDGNVDGTDSLTLMAVIDSAGAVFQTLTEKVAPMYSGEDRSYTFAQQYRVPRLSVNGAQATYAVTVFLRATEADVNLSNDTASVETCVQGGVGVSEALASQWTLGQNIPNPAMQTTNIPYFLPESGVVTLHIMSMNGQVLYKESNYAEAGNGEWTVDVTALSAGVYYYSMEYQGQRVVKKMQIAR